MKLKSNEEALKITAWREKNGVGKKSKKRTTKIPKFSIEARASAYLSGSKATKTRPPSKGGTGVKLKIAKTIFK